MRVLPSVVLACVVVLGSQDSASSQEYYLGEIIHNGPIYSTPVYPSAPVYQPTPVYQSAPVYQSLPSGHATIDPIAACCDCPTSGDCKCKDLNCTLKLWPPNCKKSGPTTKTPIRCEIVGKIPKDSDDIDCHELVKEFQYDTLVPRIACNTFTCREIGTKTIQCEVDECRPGCGFKVCIPIKKCVTKSVECKLVYQSMKHRVFLRTDPKDSKTPSFDVFVINDPAPGAPGHAGGMPREWLVMHCGSRANIQSRFPGMIAMNKGKDVKPKATPADVGIELFVKKELIKEILQTARDKASEEEVPDSTLTGGEVSKSPAVEPYQNGAVPAAEVSLEEKGGKGQIAKVKEDIDAALELALAQLSN